MGKVRQSIGALSYYETDPVKLLDVADRALSRRHPDALVTALVGILDPAGKTFTYATAGHPPPFLRRADGSVLPLPCHGLPLGIRDHGFASPVTIELTHGDLLVLYTDGLTEVTQDVLEGERRLIGALRELPPARLGDAAHYLRERLLDTGSRDDVAALTINVGERPASAPPRSFALEFDARDVRMAHESRRFVSTFLLADAAEDCDVASAELVFGELIGNVVRHAPGRVHVRIDWTTQFPKLCISDSGSGYELDQRLPKDIWSEAGRGLFLIDALTRDFTVVRNESGGSSACAVLDVGLRLSAA
jgi:anti-sigma regulatory factor (Ser/Thr protein kinase)